MFSRPVPRSARPGGQRLFAVTMRAAYRPSASATECPASTPATVPTLHDRTASCPPTERRSLSRANRPSFLRLGVVGPFEHVDPRHGDRSPRRIYPDLINPSTPCREHVLPLDWKNVEVLRSCGVDPFRTNSPGLTRRARQAFEDRPLRPLAKGNPTELHPGCLPPRDPLGLATERWYCLPPDESTGGPPAPFGFPRVSLA